MDNIEREDFNSLVEELSPDNYPRYRMERCGITRQFSDPEDCYYLSKDEYEILDGLMEYAENADSEAWDPKDLEDTEDDSDLEFPLTSPDLDDDIEGDCRICSE